MPLHVVLKPVLDRAQLALGRVRTSLGQLEALPLPEQELISVIRSVASASASAHMTVERATWVAEKAPEALGADVVMMASAAADVATHTADAVGQLVRLAYRSARPS